MKKIDFVGSLKFLTFGEADSEKCVVVFNSAYGHKNIQETLAEKAKFGGFLKVGEEDGVESLLPESWSSSLKIGSNGQDPIPLKNVVTGFMLKGGSTFLTDNSEMFEKLAGDKIFDKFEVIIDKSNMDLLVSAKDSDTVERQLNSIWV